MNKLKIKLQQFSIYDTQRAKDFILIPGHLPFRFREKLKSQSIAVTNTDQLYPIIHQIFESIIDDPNATLTELFIPNTNNYYYTFEGNPISTTYHDSKFAFQIFIKYNSKNQARVFYTIARSA